MSSIDSGSRFTKFILDGGEEQIARTINPYNLMYLQNKCADYASACVEFTYDPSNPNHFASIIEHEKLKAQVLILEELLREFNVPTETPTA